MADTPKIAAKLAEILALYDAAVARNAPPPKRAKRPMSAYARECRDMARATGYDPRLENRDPNRRRGPDKQPRKKRSDSGAANSRFIPLHHANVREHFDIFSNHIYRLNSDGLLTMRWEPNVFRGAAVKNPAHGWMIRFRNVTYAYAEVAWWLLSGTPVPEGYEVVCAAPEHDDAPVQAVAGNFSLVQRR